MGCVSSTPAAEPEPELDHAQKAAQQRRRLSVAPQQVGDIDGKSPSMKDGDANAAAAADQGAGDDSKMAEVVGGDDSKLGKLEVESRGHLRHAMLSRKGYVPYNRNKVNQDRAFVKYALQGDVELSAFGVMDGHGEFGHLVAEFVRKNLPLYLEKQENLKSDPKAAITEAVEQLTKELATTNINISFSGTTAVFTVKVKNRLYVANIGDSRCVIYESDGSKVTKTKNASRDHKPENPGEKERILRAGGRVEPLPGPPGEDCGPHRVWLKEVDVPGLAMSRSIGDEVSQTVGVISVPEILEFDLTAKDAFIVWASDGVWEFLSSEQVGDIVFPMRRDLNKAAATLVQAAHKQWSQEEEVVDDITCVIVNCENHPGSD